MSVFYQIRQDNPFGYWPLDDLSGNPRDASGNGNTGTPTGIEYGIAGPAGLRSVRVTAGSTDVVGITDHATFSSASFTLETWVNIGGIVTATPFFTKWHTSTEAQREWTLSMDAGGNLTLYIRNTASGFYRYAQSAAGAIVAGRWHHAVGVFDSATNDTIVYLDGVEVARNSVAVSGTRRGDTIQGIGLGKYGSGTVGHTNSLAHAAYFPTVLSASRILAHYQAGLRSGVAT